VKEDGDICVQLQASDTRDVEGTPFGRLDAFDEPLGLSWTVNDGALSVIRQASAITGFGVGDRPPRIELPDIATGQLVSSELYLKKPAVFYMWASW
jgi:hypothetical protein